MSARRLRLGERTFGHVRTFRALPEETRRAVTEALPAAAGEVELLLLLEEHEATAAIAWSVLHGEPGRWLDIHVSLLGGLAPDPARMRHVFAAMRALPATLDADGISADVPADRPELAAQLHRLGFSIANAPLRAGRRWLVLELARSISAPALVEDGAVDPGALIARAGGAAPVERPVAPPTSPPARSELPDLALSPEVGAWLGITDGTSDVLPPGCAVPDGYVAFGDPRGRGSWALLERGEPGEAAALLVLDQETTLRSTGSVHALRSLVAARAGHWTEIRVMPRRRYSPMGLAAVGLRDVGAVVGGSARCAEADAALATPGTQTSMDKG